MCDGRDCRHKKSFKWNTTNNSSEALRLSFLLEHPPTGSRKIKCETKKLTCKMTQDSWEMIDEERKKTKDTERTWNEKVSDKVFDK